MAEAVAAPQPDTTLAIVLGVSRWPDYRHFADAPTFRKSLEDVAAYLTGGHGLALPRRNVKVLIDSFDEGPELIRVIRRFLRDRRRELEEAGTPAADLLFYYVGHGLLDTDSRLYLTIRATDEVDRYHTSLAEGAIGAIIREGALGLRSYVVLDCCFAGAIVRCLQGEASELVRVRMSQALPGSGVALLCAAGAAERAQAPEGMAHTMFTGGLLSVLGDGIPGGQARLSLEDLCERVRERLTQTFPETAVLPQLFAPRQDQGRADWVPLFPNRAWVQSSPTPVPPQVPAQPPFISPTTPKLGPPTTAPASRRPWSPRLDAFWPSGAPPAWAHDWGTDEYGRWVRFRLPTKAGAPLLQRVRWMPPGQFMMGSPEREDGRLSYEGPQHLVTFAQGFWMFDTACTEALWQAVTGEAPNPRRGAEFPVTNVSWNDAQDFIGKANALCPGLSLTLPSEAQWEYACRAGTTTRYSFGNDISPALARYGSGGPVAVGSLPPNPWGLFEMHGNVWEWCADEWHGSYEGAPTDGSVWGARLGAAVRVFRGGSWGNGARNLRAAYRDGYDPGGRRGSLGFRCARVQ